MDGNERASQDKPTARRNLRSSFTGVEATDKAKLASNRLGEDQGRLTLLARPSTESIAVALLILLAGFLPILLYGLVFAGVPAVSALEARERLRAADARPVLVDIRSSEAFAAGHLEGAFHWPYKSIRGVTSAAQVPEPLREAELLLLCDSGIHSALAVRRLRPLSITAISVHGGMQAWTATALRPQGKAFSTLQTASGGSAPLPTRSLSDFEQLVATAASVLVKPTYMLMSIVLIVYLWASRSLDLLALRWGLILFLAGETACVFNTANYFVYGEQSDLFEFLHGLGMVLSLSYIVFALLEGLDRRVINFSHPRRRCAALPLCQSCYKYEEAPCGLKRAFTMLIPAVAIVAFIPLTAQLHMESYNTVIFGIPFNYSRPGIHQLYEIRYLPLLTLALLVVTLLILLRKQTDMLPLAKIFFSAGAGGLAYSLMMLALLTMYRDNMVWFVFWEEGTELLLIAVVATLLWVFRRGFFQRAHF